MNLADQLMSGLRAAPETRAEFQSIALEMQRDLDAWVASLRKAGVKAAHPDDGWVDRQRNTVRFNYPHFFDDPHIGDLVALGNPKYHPKGCAARLVRLTHHETTSWDHKGAWHFEPTGSLFEIGQ